MLELRGFDALFLFFSGAFALVLAAGQILQKRDDEHVNMFLLLLAVAANQLAHAFDPAAAPDTALTRRLLVIFSILLMAPLFHRYVDGMLETREGERRVPYRAIAMLTVVFGLITALEIALTSKGSTSRPLRISGILAVVTFIGFQGHLLFRARTIFLLRSSERGAVANLAMLFIVITISIGLISVIGFLGVPGLRRAGRMGIGVYLILLYWSSRLYPRFLSTVREEIARQRYIKSGLHRLDVDAIIARMRSLMEEERLYALEGLSLPQLADAVQVQRHELSEILNSVLRRGFHGFVHEYRVNAACDLLREEPDRSTVSIGAAVGFNSNSAFYKAFKQFKGMSPAKYRESLKALA